MAGIEEELEKNGYLVYTNKGNSMSPLIKQGRDVLVIRAQKDGFCKNDVALYKTAKGQYILHRIRKVLEDGYFIIGDHCTEGEFVKNDQMLGVLESVKSAGKMNTLDGAPYKAYVASLPLRRRALKLKRKLNKHK